MRIKRATIAFLFSALFLLPLTQSAQAASFSFTTIDAPFPDADTFTVLTNINPSGRIVGIYVNTGGAIHAFLDDRGAFTMIDFPGAAGTIPHWINPAGQVVGSYFDSGGAEHGYLEDGAFAAIDVPFPGVTRSTALAIKPGGQTIIGSYADSSSASHGFVDNRGGFTTLDVPFPGATATALVNISPTGQITGSYLDSSGVAHGFLDDHGVFTKIDLPFPGATFPTDLSGIVSINRNRGQIAGTYIDSSGVYHGFLDDHDVFTTIDVPGAIAP
jgi:uncharacterized membrane protein